MARWGRLATFAPLACDEARHVALGRLSTAAGRPWARPLQINWVLTLRCNFRCPMCNEIRMRQPDNPLGPEEIRGLLDQMAAWGVRRFGISGGEPMLDRARLLDALRAAAQRGIYTRVVTNGSRIDREFLDAYAALGGGHLILSIDGIGAAHDRIRGKGAWAGVERTLALVASGGYRNLLVRINTVLSRQNLDEVLGVAALCEEYGHVLWIQPYRFQLGNEGESEQGALAAAYPFWIGHEDMSRLRLVLDQLLRLKRRRPGLLLNDAAHLRRMVAYFEGGTRPNRCLVGYQRMKISPDGDAFWCVTPVGNVRRQALRDIWRSAAAQAERERNRECTRPCEWGCPYELTLGAMVAKGRAVFRAVSRDREPRHG